MSIPEIFACQEAAIRALDRLFPELEAVPCAVRGNFRQVVGVFQKFSGKRRSTELREPDGPAVFSFCLDLLPGKCEQATEALTGFQIGLPGEYCGSMDEFRSFQKIANRMSEYWEVRRV